MVGRRRCGRRDVPTGERPGERGGDAPQWPAQAPGDADPGNGLRRAGERDALGALGPPIANLAGLAPADDPIPGEGVLTGTLVAADRFGNVRTSIDRMVFNLFAGSAPVQIRLGGMLGPPVRLVTTYAEIGDGEVAALFGSTGWLEIAARSAPAFGRPGIAIGEPITVILSPP